MKLFDYKNIYILLSNFISKHSGISSKETETCKIINNLSSNTMQNSQSLISGSNYIKIEIGNGHAKFVIQGLFWIILIFGFYLN